MTTSRSKLVLFDADTKHEDKLEVIIDNDDKALVAFHTQYEDGNALIIDLSSEDAKVLRDFLIDKLTDK